MATPGSVTAMLGLSVVFMAMTFVVFALSGVRGRGARVRPRLVDRIRKAFAASFVVLSGRLAVASR